MRVSESNAVFELVRRIEARSGTRIAAGLRAAVRVARVMPGMRERARIVLVGLALGTRRVRRPLAVYLRGPSGRHRFLLPDVAALRVLEEVFCNGEYAITLPQPPARVIDLGSNVGATILYFTWQFPGCEVVGVEPSPSLFKVLEANVGGLPNVRLVNAAVSASTEPVTFFEGLESWQGSTMGSAWVDEEHAVTVAAVQLDDLIGEAGADLLKIDIEGGEFDVLPATTRLRDVVSVFGEIHADPDDERTRALLALFDGYDVTSTPPTPGATLWRTMFSAVRDARALQPSAGATQAP
ncbi:FkbM family methyltransferase [Solirubrobacter sp. CPCC 204708]|uniref:FkbM family methyltransferase n=1 Tax=Solirubrobacter deserti TaxID=2282478 RepID=A0ABT4RMZ6_9ACTN|nr:FkbM family methyltransferase [Solirubrobacter deserti]MBE2317981.1 FkbM family methyltransferase [Solirubrobacter deserti]MDA0139660.1 FkbM family methyltransferase [Solirubrobacter deserti]